MPVVNTYGVLLLFSPHDTSVISVAENPGRLRRGREREYYVRRVQNGNQIVHGILLTNRLGLNHGKVCSKCACWCGQWSIVCAFSERRDKEKLKNRKQPEGCVLLTFLIRVLGALPTETPLDRDSSRQNMGPGTETPVEGTWEKAARHEVTLYRPPPPRELKKKRENITLPQTLFSGGNNTTHYKITL